METLLKKLKAKGEKISKAEKVRSLLMKEKGLIQTHQKLTDFQEPVLDLHRRNGQIETFEKATAGKFIFTHSNGKERYIELRPSDQETRDYAGRKVRWYTCHEDRPFAGWDNPIVDGETVMLGYEKTKATDLKYQQALERLKNAGKLTWVWIILGIAGAIAIVAFAYMTWIQPAQTAKMIAEANLNRSISGTAPPLAGAIIMGIKRRFKKKGALQ